MDSYRALAIAYHILVLSPAFCLAAVPLVFLITEVARKWRRRMTTDET